MSGAVLREELDEIVVALRACGRSDDVTDAFERVRQHLNRVATRELERVLPQPMRSMLEWVIDTAANDPAHDNLLRNLEALLLYLSVPTGGKITASGGIQASTTGPGPATATAAAGAPFDDVDDELDHPPRPPNAVAVRPPGCALRRQPRKSLAPPTRPRCRSVRSEGDAHSPG